MKKIFLFFILFWLSVVSSFSQNVDRDMHDSCKIINLMCNKIDTTTESGIHRTPLQPPVVYLNTETAMLYFASACYGCRIEVVLPGTNNSVYCAQIPDGDDTVQLPLYLNGEFELHIHRGVYCFVGFINL